MGDSENRRTDDELPSLMRQPISARSEFAYLFRETDDEADVYDYVAEQVQAHRDGELPDADDVPRPADNPPPEPPQALETILRDISIGESDADDAPIVTEQILTSGTHFAPRSGRLSMLFAWLRTKFAARKAADDAQADDGELDDLGKLDGDSDLRDAAGGTAENLEAPDNDDTSAGTDEAEGNAAPVDAVGSENLESLSGNPVSAGAEKPVTGDSVGLEDSRESAALTGAGDPENSKKLGEPGTENAVEPEGSDGDSAPADSAAPENPEAPDNDDTSAGTEEAEGNAAPVDAVGSENLESLSGNPVSAGAEKPVTGDSVGLEDSRESAALTGAGDPENSKKLGEPGTENAVEPEGSDGDSAPADSAAPENPVELSECSVSANSSKPNTDSPDKPDENAAPIDTEKLDELGKDSVSVGAEDSGEPGPENPDKSNENSAAEGSNNPAENAAPTDSDDSAAENPEAPPHIPIQVHIPAELYQMAVEAAVSPTPQLTPEAPVRAVYAKIAQPIRRRKKKEAFVRKLHLSAMLIKESAVQMETVAARRARKTGASLREKLRRLAASLTPGAIRSRARTMTEHPLVQYQPRALHAQAIYALTAGGLLLALRALIHFDAIPALTPAAYPIRYALIQAGLLAAGVLAANRTVFGGIHAMFRRSPYGGADGITGILMLVCTAQSIWTIFRPAALQSGHVALYGAAALLTLGCNALGKRTVCTRIDWARAAAAEKTAETVCLLDEDTPLQELADHHAPDRLTVCTAAGADEAALAENTAVPDGSQQLIGRLSFALLAGCIAIAAACAIVTRSADSAWAALAAALCVCAPTSAGLAMNGPLLRASRRMRPDGAVAGWSTVSLLGETGRLVVQDSALFPGETLVLRRVRTLLDSRIDSAILDAAAVLHEFGGPMGTMFDRILRGDSTVLPAAEQVRAEPDGGVTGWVNGRRVVIGTGETLRKYGIAPPSRDYETKNCPPDMRFAYLAVAGELAAMFIMSYEADPALRDALRQFTADDGCLTVLIRDPNLTAPFIAECFGLPAESVQTIPCAAGTVEPEPDSLGQAVAHGGCASVLRMIRTCIRMKPVMQLASVLQLAGIVLGLLLTAVFACSGAIGQWNDALIFLFELFWFGAVIGVPSVKRL